MKTATCPVCGEEIKNNGVKATAGGKEVTVCCQECAKKVKDTPAKYAGATK